MDLSTFNKGLKQLVNRARREEARNSLKEAKDAWIEVAEFTIKFYKHTKLEPSFRNMLINKTEGIIQHAKNLDRKIRMSQTLSDLSKEQEMEPEEFKEEPLNQVESKDQSSISKTELQPMEESKSEDESIKPSPNNQISEELPDVPFKAPQKEPEIVDDSEYKNIPEGIKEIKAPKDFEVITPYDKEEIEKRLSVDGDMSIFKYDHEAESSEDEVMNQGNISIESENKKEAIICFACGERNPPGTKVCKNCGTKLA